MCRALPPVYPLRASFLYFYIEGTVFSWANPEDRPSSVQLPSVPSAAHGADVNSTVRSVAIARQPSLAVMEGQAFAVQPTIRVTDNAGAGVAGRKVFALVAEANGFVCVLCVVGGLVAPLPCTPVCVCVVRVWRVRCFVVCRGVGDTATHFTACACRRPPTMSLDPVCSPRLAAVCPICECSYCPGAPRCVCLCVYGLPAASLFVSRA